MTTMTMPRRFGEGILEDTSATQEVAELVPTILPMTASVESSPVSRGEAAPGRAGEAKGRLTIDQFDFTKHDGIVTIHNPATGQHRTFKIETLKGNWCPGRRVLAILDGPDNVSNYRRFAWVDEFGVKVWSRFQVSGRDGEPNVWTKYARMIECPRRFTERGLEYRVMAFCRRCQRPLTTPRSIALGIGRICEGKE